MEKQSPEAALNSLRSEVESEIVKSRSTERGMRNDSFTAVFMSGDTYKKLKRVDLESVFCGTAYDYESWSAKYGVNIEAAFNCFVFSGYVVIDNNLALGKVGLKRCYRKGQ